MSRLFYGVFYCGRNTLLGTHIFEAIDMPLETRTEEVAERLNLFIRDNSYLHGLVLLVDMGSLEQLDQLVDNRMDIGILNNITTSLAINVGNMICRRFGGAAGDSGQRGRMPSPSDPGG